MAKPSPPKKIQPEPENKYNPVDTVSGSARSILRGVGSREPELTADILQKLIDIAKNSPTRTDPSTGKDMSKFEIFQSMLFERYGSNSSYALFAIGAKGNRPNVPKDDEGRFKLFQEKVNEGIKLVNAEPLSVYTAVTLQALDYVKEKNADGGVAKLRPIGLALDRLQAGVSGIENKGDPTADATTALKNIGLGQREIEFIAIAAATQRALKENPQASYEDIISKAGNTAVTFQDLKDFSEAYDAAAKSTDPKTTWIIQNLSEFLSQNSIDPGSAFKLNNVRKADAGVYTGVAVADAGGPESDPTATFAATVADVTTAPAAADPNSTAPAVAVRRPAAAPDAAPA